MLAKHTLIRSATALLFAVAASPSYATPGYAQLGKGAGDLVDNCGNNPNASPDQIVYFCTVAAKSTAWHGAFWPYLVRAEAYRRLGEDDLALVDLDTAIKLSPAHNPLLPIAYHDRCDLRARKSHDYAGALSDCNQSLEIRPNDASTLKTRAAVEYELADYPAVAADCTAVLAAQPNDAFAANLLAQAKEKMAPPAVAAQSAK